MSVKKGTSKPTVITAQSSYNGQFGLMFPFDIEFEDGTKGRFITTKAEQDKFVIGIETIYSAEEKKNKKGDMWTHIKKLEEDQGSGGSGNYGGGGQNVNSDILANVCFTSALKMAAARGADVDPEMNIIKKLADKFYEFIAKESGNDKQLRITMQARLKDVCEYATQFEKVNLETTQDVVKYVKDHTEYVHSKR